MILTPELLAAFLLYAVKFGMDATLIIMNRLNSPRATIDDGIAAFDQAAKKSAEAYLTEARERAAGLPPK